MTNFTELHPFIRAVLGDSDSQNYLYSTAVLDSHIRLRILTNDDPTVQESGLATAVFTTDLTANQKAKLIYECCKSIIAPMPNEFSYKTPVHAVVRKGLIVYLNAYLDEQLANLNGGVMYVKSETELEVILNGAQRFHDAWNNALTADV